MPSTSGTGVNCFALLSRDNRCFFCTSEATLTSKQVCDYLNQFSQGVRRETVVVLDNAPVHQEEVKKRRLAWESKGMYVFFLPVYCPHLNLAEIRWCELKYEWLQSGDYKDKQTLCYQVRQALAAVGTGLQIAFKPFRPK